MTWRDLQKLKQGRIPETEKNVLKIPVSDGIMVSVDIRDIVTEIPTQAALEKATASGWKIRTPTHGATKDTHHIAHGRNEDPNVLKDAFCVVRPLARYWL